MENYDNIFDGVSLRKATPRMIEFAQAIAEKLYLPEPDYDSFDETSEFIDYWEQDYYAATQLELASDDWGWHEGDY